MFQHNISLIYKKTKYMIQVFLTIIKYMFCFLQW